MSVIIRLQNLALTANSIDIRQFFRGLSIPDGGVHIVGGPEGDAFIAFSTDEDARQAMQLTGQKLKESPVRLLLSSRNEMYKVIEQARIHALGNGPPTASAASSVRSVDTNSPSSPTSAASSSISTPITSNGNFSSQQSHHNVPGIMGMGLDMGRSNNSSSNFIPQPNHGISLSGSSASSHQSFSLSTAPESAQNNMGATLDSAHGSANTNTNLYGMPIPGVAMHFPSMMANQGGMGMNSAAMMGFHPGMLTNQPPPGSFGPRGMLSNTLSGTNLSVPPPSINTGLNTTNHGMLSGMNSGMNSSMNSGMNSSMNSGSNSSVNHGMHQGMQQGMNSGLHSMNSSGMNPMNAGYMKAMNSGGNPSSTRPPVFVPGMGPNFMSGANAMGNLSRPGDMSMNRFPGPGNFPPPRDRGLGLLGSAPLRHPGPMKPEGNKDRDKRSRSGSRERRDGSRRRRSRSRERDRTDRRRRHSRSRSRSRSPKSRSNPRRDSQNRDERRKGESSPEKIREGRGRRDSDPAPTAYNTTTEEHPGIKLTGVPKDASYREIRDFLRVDIMGGGDGTVRLYDEGIAYVKLEKPAEFPRAYRSNGRKLRNSTITLEGIAIERWVTEYKLNKSRMERDIDRDRERERTRDRDERNAERERPERPSRPSRFNAPSQSSYIVIRNLPPTITGRDVSTRLLKDTAVTDMTVTAGPVSNGRHTAVAFVKLESPQASQTAIDMIVRSQEGANLVVEACEADEFNRAKNKTPGREDREPKPLTDLGGTQSIFDLESGLDDESYSVLLKGAPPNVSERDIFDFFSDIGLVPNNVKIMYDTHGSCSGQVVVEFSDSHKARRATTKDGMLFGRGHVEVTLIPSGRKRPIDPSILVRGQQIRPALLGPRPLGIVNPRFPIPPGPNPFIQALHAHVNGAPRAGGPAGVRPRAPNPSRFSSRTDFGSSNGVDRDDRMGSSRGRGSSTTKPPHGTELEAAKSSVPEFGKQGCVLALENVPYKANMDDILHHLSSILKIDISRERIIRRFDDLEKPTGDARVAFETPAEAKLANNRLQGTKMWNRPITYMIL